MLSAPTDESLPPGDLPPQPLAPAPLAAARILVILEIIICSDYPTQFLLGGLFARFGFPPASPNGTLHAGSVIALSLIDTVVLVGLILLFVRAHRERARDIFLGSRPIGPEVSVGVRLIFAAMFIAFLVLGVIHVAAPWLHPPGENPIGGLIHSPRDAWLFALVVVVAGGIREEIQRAFLLRRFEVWLGGGTVGVVVTSVAFGAGHIVQGTDAMIATGLLGAFWGVTYLRRRSVVAPMVSHAGFDLVQVLLFLQNSR